LWSDTFIISRRRDEHQTIRKLAAAWFFSEVTQWAEISPMDRMNLIALIIQTSASYFLKTPARIWLTRLQY
jgi:hypothetical protein